MKRTLSNDQLPALTQLPQSESPAAIAPDTPAEQIQSNPVVNNRVAANSPMELVAVVTQAPIPIDQHSAPEKSNRSSSASSEAESATTDDEIKALVKAACSGDVESQFQLGECYFNGTGVAVNKEEAFMWFDKAAMCDHKGAHHSLKAMRDSGFKYEPKIFNDWLHKAAHQGHPEAQYELAKNYSIGFNGYVEDTEKGLMWCHKAAEQGHRDAQVYLAGEYQTGWGAKKDEDQSFQWYLKAAEQNSVDAQGEVSECYQKGLGVVQNITLATYWKLKVLLNAPHGWLSLNEHRELIKLIPSILKSYPEFERIEVIRLASDTHLTHEHFAIINNFIRSNPKIKILKIFRLPTFVDDDKFRAIAEVLKFNTELTRLKFNKSKPSQEIAARIEVQLTQNRDIAELRQYVKDLRIDKTPGFPLDIVKIMVDKTIVAYLKSGQTMEATKVAIDEMLITAGIKVLESDTQIN